MTVNKESLHFMMLEDLSSPAAQLALAPLKASKATKKAVRKAAELVEPLYVEPAHLDFEHTKEFKESDELLAPAMSLNLWDEVEV